MSSLNPTDALAMAKITQRFTHDHLNSSSVSNQDCKMNGKSPAYSWPNPIRLPADDGDTIRDPDDLIIAVTSDLESQCHLPKHLPPVDVWIDAGDCSHQPYNKDQDVERYIDDLKRVQKFPADYIFAVPGNHDHFLEQATGFRQSHRFPKAKFTSGEPSLDRFTTKLTVDEIERIRKIITARTLDDGRKWMMAEHGSVLKDESEQKGCSKGHPKLNLFLSGLSLNRGRTPGYSFQEKDNPDVHHVWEKLRDPKLAGNWDIVVAHGPPLIDVDTLPAGAPILDMDSCDLVNTGSCSLADAIEIARPSVVICGHIHNGGGHWTKHREDGSKTLYINAASVITGYNRKLEEKGEQFEFATRRPPTIFRYNIKTKEATVLYSWDGTIRGKKVRYPWWSAPLCRAEDSDDEGLTREELASSLQDREPTEDELNEWAKQCGDDRNAHEQEILAAKKAGESSFSSSDEEARFWDHYHKSTEVVSGK